MAALSGRRAMNDPPIVIAINSTPTTMHDKVNTIESLTTVLGETLQRPARNVYHLVE
jgi:hypothetical protein